MAERLKDAVVLLAGAGGGIGRALTQALLAAGVAEIVSAGRDHPPAHERVREEMVDITHLPTVRVLAERHAARVTVVIACAGVNANQRLFTPGFEAAARREMEVNYFGLLNLAAAFGPVLQARGSGLFVHLLTFLSHVNLPLMAGYCASKAAAHSLTQALRAELGRSGVRVCGVYPAVVDTAMSRDIPGPKLAPAELAQALVQAIEEGAEDVYPGAAAEAYRLYTADPKAAERRMAARLA
ncbi:SDR family NAD(P)-dependent oxidoreductase [Ramlibacter sp.]|uniref:SDR family NAD(P)-dependent oxidoreductase n=1 Tax=Ramlibacter sp. TaxID=1917967 RepID=UPI002FC97D8B